MPDMSSIQSSSSSSISPTPIFRESHPLTNTFTKINLSGGPYTVVLCHNTNIEDPYASVDIEAEESLHKLILINMDQNDLLTIRMTEQLPTNTKSNITLFIIFKQLNELYIDGTINVRCESRIESNILRVNHRGTGFMKLKLNVNILDAYLFSIGHVKLCGEVYSETTIKALGVGDVECRNLLTKKIQVISSGIGNIYVMAIDEISVTLSGVGTVYYSGPMKYQVKTGLGNIVEIPHISLSDDE